MEILKINSVSKRFGSYTAVDNLTISAESGKIFGLLGPNGAGKTTTIRMITNIFMPDEGSIEILGAPCGTETQNRIGYLPEERGLYKKMKVIDQLIYFGMLKELSRSKALDSARNWLRKLGAADWENKKIQELSKGMQQKVQFISSILHNPELIILDEPFSGFDPVNAETLKKVVTDLKNEGKTIILSTHIMEQVEQLCDNIALINKGKLVLSGSLRDVKSGYGKDTMVIEFSGDNRFINAFSGLQIINLTNSRAEFRIIDKRILPNQILKTALEHADVFKFELSEPSLNEIFIDVVSSKGEKSDE